jgi:L-ascorbate metabolism protein UlaG (beta-lactamase superfamily)
MGVKITWLSHSGFKLDLNGTTVLIDPFITGNPLASQFDPAEMNADYILLTHAHGDHLGDSVEIARRTNAMIIGTWEIHVWMQNQGIQNTHGQNTGGGYQHPFGHVKLVKADHSSSFPDGTYGGQACGIILTVGNQRLYFAGDTALFSDMRLIGDMGIDLAFLPIGDNFTMGPIESLQAIQWINPKAAFPIHYNTFDVIQQDVVQWARHVHNETNAKAIVTDPGAEFTLD